MSWIFIGAYVAIHFLLYVFVFRQIRYFWTERGIFLFHLLPAIALVLLMALSFARNPSYDSFALVIGAAAAHGIYSLSFLECWVLSEGGYSLRVLSEIVHRGTVSAADLEQHFLELSARKKRGRMQSLLNLGLVRSRGEEFELTPRGKRAANVIAMIARIADFRVPS